jgi:hypothetical protein
MKISNGNFLSEVHTPESIYGVGVCVGAEVGGIPVSVAGTLVGLGRATVKDTAKEAPNMFPFASAIRQ